MRYSRALASLPKSRPYLRSVASRLLDPHEVDDSGATLSPWAAERRRKDVDGTRSSLAGTPGRAAGLPGVSAFGRSGRSYDKTVTNLCSHGDALAVLLVR